MRLRVSDFVCIWLQVKKFLVQLTAFSIRAHSSHLSARFFLRLDLRFRSCLEMAENMAVVRNDQDSRSQLYVQRLIRQQF